MTIIIIIISAITKPLNISCLWETPRPPTPPRWQPSSTRPARSQRAMEVTTAPAQMGGSVSRGPAFLLGAMGPGERRARWSPGLATLKTWMRVLGTMENNEDWGMMRSTWNIIQSVVFHITVVPSNENVALMAVLISKARFWTRAPDDLMKKFVECHRRMKVKS